jgi:hypothetical protein
MTDQHDNDSFESLDQALMDALHGGDKDRSTKPSQNVGEHDGLVQAFVALKSEGDDRVAKINVANTVAEAIQPRRTWSMQVFRWAPVAAAFAVLIIVGSRQLYADTYRLVAPHGALSWQDDAWQTVHGEVELSLPARIRSTQHQVVLHRRHFRAELRPETEVVVNQDDVRLLKGRAEIRIEKPMTLRLPSLTSIAKGRLVVATAEENPMLYKNRKLQILAGVVAVVAIYSGYLHVAQGGEKIEIEGPAGALVDSDGRVRRVSLKDVDEALNEKSKDALNALALAKAKNAGAVNDEKANQAINGGYWDEKAETVRFALSGEVFDGVTGDPVEDFQIALNGTQLRSFATAAQQTVTFSGKRDGKFRLPRLGLGIWQLTITAEGYAPSKQRVALNKLTNDPYVVVPMSTGGTLTGLVSDWRGRPIQDADISIGGCVAKAKCSTTKTDAKGAFVLAGAPEERPFTLNASHRRYGVSKTPNLELSDGESQHVSITLSGVLKVSGFVLKGKERKPAAGMAIQAQDKQVMTDAAGRYSVNIPLTRWPRVRVVIGGDRFVSEFASYPNNRSAEPIKWVDGDDHVAALRKDFSIGVGTASISGKITRDGVALANTEVEIKNTMGWASFKRGHQTFPEQTLTDAGGNYRIDNVPIQAGYVVMVSSKDQRQKLGTIVVEKAEDVIANFDLAGSVIRGTFLDRETKEPQTLYRNTCSRFGAQRKGDAAIYLATCLEEGRFEIRGISPGDYRLLQVAPKLYSEVIIGGRDVRVVAGQKLKNVEVFVKGKKRKTWKVRVTDPQGRFVAPLVLRYLRAKGSRTQGLRLRDDGLASFTIPVEQKEVFIDAPGYESARLILESAELGSGGVIDVRMSKSAQP